MWHEYIHKSPQEIRELERVHEQKRQEKERRKAEQKANVEKKRKERLANGDAEEASGRRSKRLKKGKHICACKDMQPGGTSF